MKRNILLSVIFAFVFNSSLLINNGIGQWERMSNGIGNNQTVNSLAISGNNIFAGLAGNGVYLSTNNGTTWTQTALNNKTVLSIVTLGNNIFAGTSSNGVYLSTNSGTSWTQTELNNKKIFSLSVRGTNVFAGTLYSGIYLSSNNGANWTQTALNNKTVYAIATNGINIFGGVVDTISNSNYSGIYRSSDDGMSWSHILYTNNMTTIINCIATSGDNIFAGSNSEVLISENNGSNWASSTLFVNVLTLITSGNNIFAGAYAYTGQGNGAVYFSNNNGTSWVHSYEGFNDLYPVKSLLIANNYILAGTEGQSIWRRTLTDFIGIKYINTEVPSSFSLSQNYPNPFNPMTNIKFAVPKSSEVKIVVYDISGKELEVIVNEKLQAGTYQADWNGSNYSSGVYFYKIMAGDFVETRKMMMVK
ncbi:MAG: T9SS type A sorting domain-containing protein [Ignavibacteriae bacterium]|nr:T9SS type A sorting domain-containing protein [Ignavibacteriota bacterium]